MRQRIAIEPELTPVREFLTSKGFTVENINIGETNSKKIDSYDAIVVTGLNTNVLGINDTSTKAVIIDAKGLTPEQVYDELQSRFE